MSEASTAGQIPACMSQRSCVQWIQAPTGKDESTAYLILFYSKPPCKRKFCWLYLVNVNNCEQKASKHVYIRYVSDQVLHCTTASLRRAPAFLANAVILNPLTDRIFLRLASHSNLDVHPRMILLVHSPIAIRIYQIYIIIILYIIYIYIYIILYIYYIYIIYIIYYIYYIIYIFTHYAVYVYSTTRNA